VRAMAGGQIVLYERKHVLVLERAVRRRLWRRWPRIAAGLPFAQAMVAAYFCAVDSKTPLRVELAPLERSPAFCCRIGSLGRR
jgi:hypothetical protein